MNDMQPSWRYLLEFILMIPVTKVSKKVLSRKSGEKEWDHNSITIYVNSKPINKILLFWKEMHIWINTWRLTGKHIKYILE